MTEPSPRAVAPRRSLARRLSWLWIVILGVLAYVAELYTLLATRNPNFIPSLILLGSVIAPASVLAFAASRKNAPRQRAGVLAFTAVGGGIVGTIAAGMLEYDTVQTLHGIPVLMVGLIEEAAKLVVPFFVFCFVRPRDPRTGVVVGVASGMGFATLETMGYAFTALLQHGIAGVDQTLLLRGLLSPAGHVAWTGLICFALWRLAARGHRLRKFVALLVTFVVAVLLHAAWDGFSSIWVRTVVGLFSFIALLIRIHQASRPTASPAQPPILQAP